MHDGTGVWHLLLDPGEGNMIATCPWGRHEKIVPLVVLAPLIQVST